MPSIAVYLVIFTGLGIFFLFIHLMMGKFIRPSEPDAEKLTIYECGEPTIGSAFVQFDLRYYVVALLFIIFDVEVVFFFPWSIVFGKANTLSQAAITSTERDALTGQLFPALPALPGQETVTAMTAEAAQHFAILGFVDILVFFGVLLVGFAYVWKRGDINWVRTTGAQAVEPRPLDISPTQEQVLMHR